MTRRGGEEIYLSVVAPVYNEVDNVANLVHEIASALAELDGPWEIVLANDASDDGSADQLRRLMGTCPQLRVVSLAKRSGQTAALDAALRAARGRIIATLDADLQNDPADITRLIALIEDGRCDMVQGWRKDRRDSGWRRLISRSGNRVRNWLTREKIHDSGCGLKVFRRVCIQRMKLFNGLHRYFVTLVRMEGFRVMEVVVNHRPRRAGTAKYGFWNRFSKVIRDALAVRWMQNRLLRYEAEEWSAEGAAHSQAGGADEAPGPPADPAV